MLNKKGFTLVELLAVIVILAIILAVAIPSVTGIVNNAKRNAFEESAKMFLRAIDYKLMQDGTYDVTQINKTTTEDNIESELKIDSSNYKRVTVTLAGNKPTVSIIGDNKWEGLTASGDKSAIVVTDTVVDTTPPVITLINYYNPDVWTGGNIYSERGATAIDNVDGDITDDIIIDTSNLPSPYAIGDYVVTYTVTDSSGNTTVKIRNVRYMNGGPM